MQVQVQVGPRHSFSEHSGSRKSKPYYKQIERTTLLSPITKRYHINFRVNRMHSHSSMDASMQNAKYTDSMHAEVQVPIPWQKFQ